MPNNLQRHLLRPLAHAKKPVVIISINGLTPSVIKEIDTALCYHELVKIKVNAKHRQVHAEIVKQICESLNTETIQRLDHTAILFRRNDQKFRFLL
jgi:RNA-binding protein